MRLTKVALLLLCCGFWLQSVYAENMASAGVAASVVVPVAHSTANASGVVMQTEPIAKVAQDGGIPWGIISILVMLLFIGLLFFRKSKANPSLSSGNSVPGTNVNMFNLSQGNSASGKQNKQIIPGQGQLSTNLSQDAANNTAGGLGTGNLPKRFGFMNKPQVTNEIEKMPDGIEPVYFLRQARGIFLHMQSAETKNHNAEIAKYMTPELYQKMYDTIAHDGFVADFSQLDCQLIRCEEKDKQLCASVRFFGLVNDKLETLTPVNQQTGSNQQNASSLQSAETNQTTQSGTLSQDLQQSPIPAAQQFSEIWHFIKTDLQQGKWLVAGIEQDSANK